MLQFYMGTGLGIAISVFTWSIAVGLYLLWRGIKSYINNEEVKIMIPFLGELIIDNQAMICVGILMWIYTYLVISSFLVILWEPVIVYYIARHIIEYLRRVKDETRIH